MAKLLGGRKEQTVPSALLSVLKNDPHLEVRRYAKESFCSVTNYKSGDVFDLEDIDNWWKENKESVNSKLNTLEKIDNEPNTSKTLKTN